MRGFIDLLKFAGMLVVYEVAAWFALSVAWNLLLAAMLHHIDKREADRRATD